MRIGDFDLDRDVLVIAEVGNNHEGSFDAAVELVRLAAQAGAGAVKFQTIVPERLVPPSQAERLAQLKRFALSYEQFAGLKGAAADAGIMFLSTPFDLESAKFLAGLVPAFKIASGDNDFVPLLEAVAETGKPVMLSTGLADLARVERAAGAIRRVWARRGVEGDPLALLQCSVAYPTPPAEADLTGIRELASLGATVGYSDHTLGIEAAVLSVAAGARIVEKHFTADKSRATFRDHALSADPADLAELVRRVAEANEMLGSGKRIGASECPAEAAVRRSIAAARDLRAGQAVTFEDLAWLRGIGGMAPGREGELVGRVLGRDLSAGDPFRPEDVA